MGWELFLVHHVRNFAKKNAAAQVLDAHLDIQPFCVSSESMSGRTQSENLIREATSDACAQTAVGLEGLAKSHLVWRLAQQKAVVWVVPDFEQAEQRLMDLHFFAPNEHRQHIRSLPFEERTPYHATSPDPAVVMERSATLFKLFMGDDFKVLVVTPEALVRRHPPMDAFQKLNALARQR